MTDEQRGSAYVPKQSGKDASQEEQSLTAIERDQLVAELRYQTAYYLEAVQAMLDGVMLGAENVQDKRIALLEAGPPVTTESYIFTIAMTLVLEGTVGPALAGIAARLILRPILQATGRAITSQSSSVMSGLKQNFRLYRDRAAFAREAASAISALPLSSQSGVKRYADACLKLADDLRSNLAARRELAKSMRKTLNDVTQFVENNLVAAAKIPGAVAGGSPDDKALDANRSAGVELLAAAMTSASRMRLLTTATHEALEAQLKNTETTRDQANKLLDEYRVDGHVDLAALRSGLALATEAMVWARLLMGRDAIDRVDQRDQLATDYLRQRDQLLSNQYWSDPVAGIRPSDDYVRLEPQDVVAGGRELKLAAPDNLTDYLLARFGRDLQRWVADEKKIVFTREAWDSPAGFRQPRDESWWSKVRKPERIDLLVQYLAAIAKGIPADELKLQ